MNRKSRLITWFLVLFALFSIPWAALLWLIEDLETRRWDEERLASRTDLREIMAHVFRLSQRITWGQDRLDRYCRALRWNRAEASRIGATLLPCGRLFLFDSHGKRVSAPGATPGLEYASEQCFRAVRASRSENLSLDSRTRRVVDRMMGSANSLAPIARNPGKLLDLSSFGIPKLAGVFPCSLSKGKRGFAMAVFERAEINPDTLAREALARISPLAPAFFSFALQDLGGVEKILLLQGHDPSCHPALVDRCEMEVGGRLYRSEILERRFLLVGSIPFAPTSSWLMIHAWQVGASSAAALGFLTALLWWINRRGVPIRLQLMGLFGLSGLCGSLLLLWFAGDYLAVRERAAIRDRRKEAAALLTKADSGFPAFKKRLEAGFQRLVDRLAETSDDRGLGKALGRLDRAWREWLFIYISDSGGRIRQRSTPTVTRAEATTFGGQSDQLFSRGISLAFRHRKDIQTTAEDDLPQDLEKSSPIIRYTAEGLVHHPGEISDFRVGKFGVVRFGQFFQNKSGESLAIIGIFNHDVAERLYLKKLRQRWRRVSFPVPFTFEIFGLPEEEIGPMRKPDRQRRFEPVIRLHGLVNQNRSVRFLTARFGTSTWELVGQPGANLRGFQLGLGFPTAPIVEETRWLRFGMILLAGIQLAFTLGLGAIFSSLVLQPVQNLFTGLENLATGRYSQRVDVGSGDELEYLAVGVNGLMIEMEELGAAGVIQRQLLPRGSLRLGHLEIAGRASSESQVGGGIYDLFQLPGEEAGVGLIRLPGHAVGSALLLAAAKAHLRIRLAQGRPDLDALLEEVWRFCMHWAVPAQPSNMIGVASGIHLLLGRISPAQGKIEMAWKGHFQKASWEPGAPPEICDLAEDASDKGSNRCVLPEKGFMILAVPGLLSPDARPGSGLNPGELEWLLMLKTRPVEGVEDLGAILMDSIRLGHLKTDVVPEQTFLTIRSAEKR